MKQIDINISHKSETVSTAALESVFTWITAQMNAVSLEECDYVSVSTNQSGTIINFNLATLPDESQPEA